MKIPAFNTKGKKDGSVDVPADLLDVTPRGDVMHAVVTWQQAKRRQWTAHTKTRSEVRGGGRKPWRQKGTGRARAGSRRSPIWRGGGTIHGPRTKDVKARLPKKVRRLGLRMALADRAAGESLKIVKGLDFETPNTREAAALIDTIGGRKTLVVVGDGRETKGVPSATERAFRNLDKVKVLQAEGINVYDVLNAEVVLVAEGALDTVYRRLGHVEAAA